MRSTALNTVALALAIALCVAAQTAPPTQLTGQDAAAPGSVRAKGSSHGLLPEVTATIFSPGVISGVGSNLAPAFAPDSSIVLFSRKTGESSFAIFISRRGTNGWSPPLVAPFSGHWADIESSISFDGSYVIFASNRPVASGGKPLTTHYQGGDQLGGNLWRVDLSRGAWGQPKHLGASVNSGTSVWTPSIAKNGDLFFMSTDPGTGRFRIHVARADRHGYAPTEDLAFSTGAFTDVDPVVDPRQRFLIFSSDRARPGTAERPGTERLFIAFNPRSREPRVCSLSIAGWEDQSLSQIEARLGRDGRTLYFSSRRRTRAAGALPTAPWDDGKLKIWVTALQSDLWRAAPETSEACRAKAALD